MRFFDHPDPLRYSITSWYKPTGEQQHEGIGGEPDRLLLKILLVLAGEKRRLCDEIMQCFAREIEEGGCERV